MSRLPTPGQDNNVWGDVLNDYLGVSLAGDGTLKSGVVTTTQIADGTITTTDISATAGITRTQLATGVQSSLASADSALQSVPDATTSTKGAVQLAGDLGGTAAAPTVPTKLNLTGGTLTGNLTQTADNSRMFIKNTNGSQYNGASMVIYNNQAGMGNEAGVMMFAGINNSGATKGYFTIDKIDYNAANNSHIMFFDLDANTITMSASLLMGANTITNLPTPVNPSDAATKSYVDSAATSGGMTRSIVAVAANLTAAAAIATDYVYYWSNSTAYTLTMPTAVGNTNRYTLKNASTVTQPVATSSSQTIEGGTSITITKGNSVDLISNGSNWMVI